MKIAFYEIANWEIEILKENFRDHELFFFQQKFSNTSPPIDTDILSVFIGSRLTAELVEKLPSLKFVATRSTGFDQIDMEACKKKSVPVSNVPVYGQNTVAELAFGLILTLARKIYPGIKRVREQGLFNFDALQGFDLQGKILGIVGTGHIGEYVVKIAKGFGMEVIAYDPYPKKQLEEKFGIKYMLLDELLASADITTLHVPYMPSTHHLINISNIMKMKRGSIIINTARGGLVETQSLVEALRSGVLAGAGLDVIEEEGFITDELELMSKGHPNEAQLKTVLADHELMHMDNVIITPHLGAQTKEALRRILNTTIDNLNAFISGKPQNVVNK